jgi:hypothetical protein
MNIFTKIDAPEIHQEFSKQHKVQWYTWSDKFTSFSLHIVEHAEKYGEPEFINYDPSQQFTYTFAVDIKRVESRFLKEMSGWTKNLSKFKTHSRLVFFDQIFSENINEKTYHFLIALFRTQLTSLKKDPMSSLYAPLTVNNQNNDFPLHCDLYPPKRLWNVYEDVAPGEFGASLFLPVRTLLRQLAPNVKTLPKQQLKRLSDLIHVESHQDRYNAFFDILYNNHLWSAALKRVMHQQCLSIKFQKGQGYMINDRVWMHGRTQTNSAITARRLHRLIF